MGENKPLYSVGTYKPRKKRNAPDSAKESGAIGVSVVVAAPITPAEVDKRTPIEVSGVNPLTWEVGFRLVNGYNPLVDAFRRYRSFYYNPQTKANYMAMEDFLELRKVLEDIKNSPNIQLTVKFDYKNRTKEQIDYYLNAPDISVDLEKRSKQVIIRKGPRMKQLQLYGMSTLTFDFEKDVYRCSQAELYLLPDIINRNYKEKKIGFSDDALAELSKQSSKRAKIANLVKAETAEWEDVLSFPLMPFQKVAGAFAEAVDYRCIVAYDMGLGKTPISISIVEHITKLLGREARALIVSPANLVINWMRELDKTTKKQFRRYTGVSPDSVAIADLVGRKFQYNIINYDVIGRELDDGQSSVPIRPWVSMINMSQFDVIIYDEGHYMKNTASQRSQGGRLLESTYCIILTGTPIVNRPMELYSLLSIVDKKVFASEANFGREFVDGQTGGPKNTPALHKLIEPFMIRRRKLDVIKDLPPITRIYQEVELSKKARAHYNKVLDGLYVPLSNPGWMKEVTNMLVELMRLKQICAEDKAESTVELIKDTLESSDGKVLVFSQFLDCIKKIGSQFTNNSVIITGETPEEVRYERIDKFQTDPNCKVAILSTKIGAEGLTLTAADYVIFNDLMWTPKDHMQAEARCYGRMNDMHSATSTYILAKDTIDTMIMDLLRVKMGIIEEIVEGVHNQDRSDDGVIKELLKQLRGSWKL